jgi:predicted DNA-binding transcriptional regulator AlpA
MTEKTNLNDIIVSTILKNVPKNIKPVIFLMELLNLSRESIYRRIRKEIPFSVEELSSLSHALSFSIDEVIEESKNEHVFFNLQSKITTNASNAYLTMLQEYYDYMDLLTNAEKANVHVAVNYVPPMFSIFFEHLSKFYYYKWMNENTGNTSKYYYSDLTVPPELVSLHKNIKYEDKRFNNNVLIISPNIFLSLIQSIQYYYQRKLITCEEFQLLNKDIFGLIDLIENMTKTGVSHSGIHMDVYLSSPYINSNSVYMEYNNIVETHLWLYSANPMIIRNANVCEMQKKWILSLKKQSTLITQSNEILQEEFFDKQRNHIKNMVQNRYINKI